jgi:hypothetical protein
MFCKTELAYSNRKKRPSQTYLRAG